MLPVHLTATVRTDEQSESSIFLHLFMLVSFPKQKISLTKYASNSEVVVTICGIYETIPAIVGENDACCYCFCMYFPVYTVADVQLPADYTGFSVVP